jgi:transposase
MKIEPKTLYGWYRNVISNYIQDKETGKFASNKVYEFDLKTGEIQKEQIVHIVKPENIGESMCIDEKMIGKKYSTIISNQQTGKIALLIDSVKPTFVKQSIELLGKENLERIQFINLDMSPVMKKICSDSIPKAEKIIDKFHVIKHIMEALNTVRLEIKQELKQSQEPATDNPNGWTDLELLEKSRYLLYKMWITLDQEDKSILETVFRKYPDLSKAYNLVQEIRNWYDKRNIGTAALKIENQLDQWIMKANQTKIKAFKFIVKMFEKHRDDILRYFQKGLTNAKAENLNAKIQRFILNNYGTRDKDFFFYRTQIYFA